MESRYLYRGKRAENGEWVEGFYFCMTNPDGRHTHHFIIPLGADLSLGTPVEKIQVEVDPETICQCTGIEDAHKKLIWEKDIVKRTDACKIGEPSVGIIEYDNKNTAYIIHWIDIPNYSPMFHWSNRIQVIGSIFDPELLEV